jgi:hypothetical protein
MFRLLVIEIRIRVLIIFIIGLLITAVFLALGVLFSIVPLRCTIIKVQEVLYKYFDSGISNICDISRNCIKPSVACL